MKTFYVISVCATLFTFHLLSASVSAALVHHYPFDSDTQDAVGTAHGTLHNGATLTTTAGEYAVGSGALKIAGGSQHVKLPQINFGNTFSIAAWFYYQPGGTAGAHTLIANRPTGAFANGFHLYVAKGSNLIIVETSDGSSFNAALSSSGAASPGGYHHLAMTMDRTNGTARLYWDGVDVTSDSSVMNNFGNNNIQTWLGSATNNNFVLDGFIDDLRIYNTVLSADQVEALAVIVPEPSTVALSLLMLGSLAFHRRGRH